ncbi:hypothetical protein INT45_005673 [Circinella minor]|uniref:Uncharacterized protein n=1 Tax=Circinella minor TaxID=1195481 RepID=A0A8H7VLB4_9FUNG|nr:hypothetical protein INT45_005673 [Circinella minor]
MHTFQFINKFLHRHPIEPINEEEHEEQDILKNKKNKKINSWKQMFLFDDSNTTQDIRIQKYLHDPMRNTNTPDRLGEFYDPMAVYHHGHLATMSYDITNTGA